MTLTTVDYINGTFALSFAIVTIFVGLRIASKYFEYKHKTFLYIGIGWSGFSCGWWGSGFGFLYYLLTGNLLEDTFYIFVTVFFIPIFTYIFVYGLAELVFRDKKKLIIRLVLFVIDVLFMLYLVVFFIIDPSQIGAKTGTFDLTFKIIVTIWLLFDFLVIYIVSFTFALKGMRSDDKELKLKGKILMIAFHLLLIGAILDSAITLTALTLIITRTILISCSILFYIGYLLPNRIKRILLKEST